MSNSRVSSTSSHHSEGHETLGSAQEGRSRMSGSDSSSIVTQASEKARQLASDATETVTQQAKRLLDGQMGAGADLIATLAGATRSASKDLERDAPQIAKLVQSVADRADAYSGELRGQSVEDVVRAASQFTRRQPALVFGLAALAGFFTWRVVKAAPTGSHTMSSPSIQPYSTENRTRPSHGTRTY